MSLLAPQGLESGVGVGKQVTRITQELMIAV